MRYCHAWRTWFVWDGARWIRDVGPAIERLAKQTALSIYEEASLEKDDAYRGQLGRWARTSESKQHIRAMVDLATSEPGIPIRPLDFDQDAWLLNCKNGTIDLKNGNLQPHERNDFITKLAPVDFEAGATCEVWERSLNEALEDDAEMVAFLARAVGYSATGTTGEEVLFFIWGPSGSFKSTFIETIKANLGDYAMTAAFSTFLYRREQGGARSDIARLPGARFVPAVETGRGSRMDEGLVKNLTGGDRITTRSLYEKEFEFDPAFTIWLVANDPPHVHHDDDAMWRRLIRVPFLNAIPKEKRDPGIKAFLKQPHSGVLAWIVKGVLNYQERGGLRVPESVKRSTEEYRESMDPLDDFIRECCMVGPDCWIVFANLWEGYRSFQDEAGKPTILESEFRTLLSARHITTGRRYLGEIGKTVRVRLGITIRGVGSDASDAPDRDSKDSSLADQFYVESSQVASEVSDATERTGTTIDWRAIRTRARLNLPLIVRCQGSRMTLTEATDMDDRLCQVTM